MVVVVKKFWDWQLTREFLKQYLNEKQNCYFQSGHLQEVVTYKKWSLWQTVDRSRAAGCGGEGNDGGVDWCVDGDSGCGSYCFGGSEGAVLVLKQMMVRVMTMTIVDTVLVMLLKKVVLVMLIVIIIIILLSYCCNDLSWRWCELQKSNWNDDIIVPVLIAI